MEILDKAGLTYFWSKLKAFITKDYDRTISRGEQLVTNGSAMMGDNTNFSNWSYDGAEAFNSSGSFTRAQDTTRLTLLSDDYFPVNPVNTYELSVAAKSLNGLTKLYSMPVFFDADKRAISSETHMYRPSTLTTLAQELKNGDTVVHLTDLTNWDVNTATRTYQRGFIFWNYKNSFGYEYPENTYSRNVYYNLYPDANVNKTAKTITLTSPWNKGTFPAGTKVSQCDSGATYKYVGWVNTTVTTEWITRAGLISGVGFSGRNDTSKFPPATAYCKIGFLWNYNQANDKTWITNVSFKEVLVPASSTPLMDGTAAVGTSLKYAREDHRHPSDTNKVDKESGKGLSTNDFTDALKTKLDGIAAGAEVNQNAFSNVVVGSTTIAADGKTDTLTLVAGSNVTLTPDATNDKVTIAATDTTYSAATQSASGLMSASDKTKLDGVATGATANTGTITGITTTSPLTGSGTSGSVALSHANSGVTAASKGDTSDQTPAFGSTFKVPSGTVNATGHLTAFGDHTVKIPDAVASASAAGLMSAADKKKLDLAHYGTCSVATAVKTVACTNFVLEMGAWIAVKFTATNTATSFTLNVNSTGAKSVYLYGSASGLANKFLANHTYLFIYDGTYWQAVGDIDTTEPASTMTQGQASAGTLTTGMLISPKVLVDTISEKVNTGYTSTDGSSASVANNTWKDMQTVSLDAGTYLVTYGVCFGTNANGYRQIALTDSASEPSNNRHYPTAPSHATVQMNLVSTKVIELTATTTMHLWARQNSGSALTSYPFIETLKLK